MSIANEDHHTIVVSGDPAIEWNLMSNLASNDQFAGGIRNFTRICSQPGGAALLGALIDCVAAGENTASEPVTMPAWIVEKFSIPENGIHPSDTRYAHAVSIWESFPEKAGSAWRVKEFLGIDCAAEPLPPAVSSSSQACLIVLDDNGLGFRDDPSRWPQALFENDGNAQVVLKMSRPVAQGALWSHLHDRFAGRLIVVIPVEELRQSEVQISRELSWERTAQDVAWELAYNPRVNALADCAHVIVTFENAGAILFSRQMPDGSQQRKLPECTLFFDPNVVEGMWEQAHKGSIPDPTVCLVASIVRQLIQPQPDLRQAITAGLSAMRSLHLRGYDDSGCGQGHPSLAFPLELIAGELRKTSSDFVAARVQFPTRLLLHGQPTDGSQLPVVSGMWTILQEQYTRNLFQVSCDIVERGPEVALKNVPYGKFGKLFTVDRREIEGFRSIRSLILEYCSKKQSKRPLSIAVFGPPGSGKSFGIKQIARSLGIDEIEDITFNLSQMRSPDDLISAFHRVRDLCLAGKIPLVFFDEFDTALDGARLGWLRCFLAPMQDGEFLEGQTPHPIGKVIFVFAGGTCSTIDEFNQSLSADFKAAKGPDFVSRLRGYVNIYGANPPAQPAKPDPYYIIRRAILLRSVLAQSVPPSMTDRRAGAVQLRIDEGVLRAMLLVGEYKHGVRSMEAIIDMSQLAGKDMFERSCLPSEAQLNLHVNGLEFLSLVQSLSLEGDVLERLAEANHDVFCEKLAQMGYVYGSERDPVKRTHPLLVPYTDLPEEYKHSNRNSIRDIPVKLAMIGYVMTPARSNEPPFDFPGSALEQLAEMEHDRYMLEAVEMGWHYEPDQPKKFPVDPTLLPWTSMTRQEIVERYPAHVAQAIGEAGLPEAEKEKDRVLVRNIPTVLTRVGYTVLKLEG